ncbi:hypothetical protein V2I01_34615 [Micromonospora sp. BRA006-A]|nr:hypothetical protein [Micromonospora sp. BRA006-A]
MSHVAVAVAVAGPVPAVTPAPPRRAGPAGPGSARCSGSWCSPRSSPRWAPARSWPGCG